MIDNDFVKWQRRLAFVDMFWKTIEKSNSYTVGYIFRNGGGLCSRGSGKTVGEAISSAASGQNIDWGSVDKKITQKEWEKIAHE